MYRESHALDIISKVQLAKEGERTVYQVSLGMILDEDIYAPPGEGIKLSAGNH